jgi:hypothetical protein
MLYIGEILFANAAREEGLGWTKQAINIADSSLRAENGSASAALNTDRTEAEARKKCRECLLTGVSNWGLMLNQLQAEDGVEPKTKTGWLGGWLGAGGEDAKERRARLEREKEEFEALRERVVQEGIAESAGRIGMKSTGGVWMG